VINSRILGFYHVYSNENKEFLDKKILINKLGSFKVRLKMTSNDSHMKNVFKRSKKRLSTMLGI